MGNPAEPPNWLSRNGVTELANQFLRIEGISVTIPKQIAVQLVRPAFQSDVDDGATFYSELHTWIGLDVEFGNSVERDQGCGRARDSGLTERGFAIVAIVVRDAVHCEIVGGGALAVDVETLKAAAGTALHAGDAVEKIVEVAPVIGKILHFTLDEESAEAVFGGFDERSDGLHFDGFHLRSDLQGEICLSRDGDIDAGLALHRFESGGLDRQAILTGIQIDDAKKSGVVGGGGLLFSGRGILRAHASSGDSRIAGISDRAGNIAGNFLGEKRSGDDEAS